jgi:hypothetical protein
MLFFFQAQDHPMTHRMPLFAAQLAKTTGLLAATAAFSLAHAQNTPIKFQLDWRFEGPAALFLQPVAKGYFKDAKLDVTVDAGNGSGAAVTAGGHGHLRHGLRRPGRADGVPRQQPRRAQQAGGRDDGLQQHAGRGDGAEEVGHQDAGRPERQEAGRAGVRRRPPRLPDLPRPTTSPA